MRAGVTAVVLVILSLSLPSGSATGATYTVFDLGLPLGTDLTFGTYIDNTKDVAAQGYSPGSGIESVAYLWAALSALPMTSMETLGGSPPQSLVNGLNDLGQAVGCSAIDNSGNHDGFLWSKSSPVIMRLNLGSSAACAGGINATGWIVGHSDLGHAVLLLPPYAPGTAMDLHSAVNGAADTTDFNAINGNQQFAGTYSVAGNFTAFVFDYTTRSRTDIPNTLGGTGLDMHVSGINDSGQVVGQQLGPGPGFVGHGFIFSGGTTNDVAPLAGDGLSYLDGINNAPIMTRAAVGASCGGGPCRGIIVSAAAPFTVTDVNTLLPAGSPHVEVLGGINDAGYIAGTATIAGASHAVLLSPCGNGISDPSEQCDDGNTTPGDGCSSACQVETGWHCTGQPSVCTPVCGDGTIIGGEQCDDGNTGNGDGCSSTCHVETGWNCAGEPSACSPICGDGTIIGGEKCDDHNTIDGDGCSSRCQVETGWSCAGVPSTCMPICGDHIMVGGEPCDAGADNGTLRSCCTASCTKITSGPCDDQNPCTTNDACDANGVCVGGAPTNCDDGLPCTADQCISGVGCPAAPRPTIPNCDGGNSTGAYIGGPANLCDPPATRNGSNCILRTTDGSVSITIPDGALPTATNIDLVKYQAGSTCPTFEFLQNSNNANKVADCAQVVLPPGLNSFTNPAARPSLTFTWANCNNSATSCDVVWGVSGAGCTSGPFAEGTIAAYLDGTAVAGRCIPTSGCQSTTNTYPTSPCATDPNPSSPSFGQPLCDTATCAPGAYNAGPNTWTLTGLRHFSEYAIGTACLPMSRARLRLGHLDKPGAGTLSFTGTLAPAGASFPPFDPVANGMELILNDATGVTLDQLVPPGAYWRVSGDGKRWTYYNATPAPPAGIYRVTLDASHGTPIFKVKGRRGTYSATPAVRPQIVMPDSLQCFATGFPGPASPVCTERGNPGYRALLCR